MKRRAGIPLVLALAVLAAPGAGAAMKSTKLADGTCETLGGARIVPIPGFPGERIDRRLLTDLRWLKRRYPIFITDGFSRDPVHSANGEHPLGLALDIVPDEERGGTWADITALARWAERRQDRPRAPFRWVGYNGDAGHGRGHHLHLSWNHSMTKPGKSPRAVYTLRCPGTGPAPAPAPDSPEGGTEPEPVPAPPSPPPPTGGIGAKPGKVVVETGGVDAGGR
ncbi:MAG TPA: hypothetical protein VHF58_03755 [Solirubrobacterales bacterium]|nr:hypothetical protein [Solirubrobacterales bacterium]